MLCSVMSVNILREVVMDNNTPVCLAIRKLVENLAESWELKQYIIEIQSLSSYGFSGDTFVVFISGSKNNTQFAKKIFAKSSSVDSVCRDIFQSTVCYQIEIFAYKYLLPELNLILEEITETEDSKFKVPTYLGGLIEDDLHFILLEYLNDYETLPLLSFSNEINVEGVIASVEATAEFHALSFAFKMRKLEKYSQLMSTVQRLSNNRDEHWLRLVTFTCDLMIQAIDSPLKVQTVKNVLNKLHSLYNDAINKTKNKIIIHGDCHLRNFTYKYGDGASAAVETTALLDYQRMELSSPAQDLNFLFAGILETEAIQIDALQDIYFDKMKSYLNALKLNIDNIYPKTQFLEDMKTFSFVSLTTVSVAYMCGILSKDIAPERKIMVDMIMDKVTKEDFVGGEELQTAKDIINKKVDQILSRNPHLLSM